MREVRFRAWCESKRRYFMPEEMAKDQFTLLPTGFFINVSGRSTSESRIFTHDEYLPEQFTGRKIEDADIYEGDLIYITIFDCFGGDKQYTCRVEWWGSAFWLISVENEEDRWDLDFALSQDDEPEIRGNIHDKKPAENIQALETSPGGEE